MTEATAPGAPDRPPIEHPWSQAAEDVLRALEVRQGSGLDQRTVGTRRRRYGPNSLRAAKPRSAWRILVDQLRSPMVALLAAAAVFAFLLVDWIDGTAIAAVIAINAAVGFFTEIKAARSMEALHRLGQVTARVRRDGRAREIPAAELVPGDIMLVEGGDVVTADLRIVAASKLQSNESMLTGESAPVAKTLQPVAEDTQLAERTNMLYKGTAVTRGSGEAVVVATGLATELGRITELVAETEDEATPLELRLERLGQRLIWVTAVLAAAAGTVGIAAGRDMVEMLQTAIALAVATVPEGLPVVATVALARGMWRMARHNALVNRLSAVETLGATGVICTDKTGTLTENRMAVIRVVLPTGDIRLTGEAAGAPFEAGGRPVDPRQHPGLREALEVGVLCNNAELSGADDPEGPDAVGDPMEAALLVAGERAGISRQELIDALPEEREEAFDTDTRMMATFHRHDGGLRVAVKGAPEAVIAACTRVRSGDGDVGFGDPDKQRWLDTNAAMGSEGLRVLALATRHGGSTDDAPYSDLVFLGLVGLDDPPRADVREAIARCRSARIRVVMVTGDQALTARHVALAVGLVDDGDAEVLPGDALKPIDQLSTEERERLRRARIFARVDPRQKLDLIALHQLGGEVVAMTGDGVNDAPALKKSDIGVAMGQRGTQVAREAADMVLKDDAFGTIVLAIEQGRIIFDNIRKFVLYLLSCNVSEVLVVTVAMLMNAPLPLLPLQILFLNLVTDVFPALALGVGPGDPRVMERAPRPADEPIMTHAHWVAVAAYGALITAAVLGAFAIALLHFEMPTRAATTISFLTLAFAQLWHVFNMRDAGSGFLWNDVVRNGHVWGALLLCVSVLMAAVHVPVLAQVLDLEVPGATGWGLVLAFSLLPWAVIQAYLQFWPAAADLATAARREASAPRD